MKIPRKTPTAGVVLPTLILVTLILMMMAGALLTGGTASLRVATHDQQSNQALYAAEAGLARASEQFSRSGSLPQPYQDVFGLGSHYKVTKFENMTETEMTISTGLRLPPGTVYLLSEGFSENGTPRKAGALFVMGLEAFELGALADHFTAINSSFDAYNSDEEGEGYEGDAIDPESIVDDAAILGSNINSGEAYNLTNVEVNGNLFVGPGGVPADQITRSGSVTITQELSLQRGIDVPDIELPTDLEAQDPFDTPNVTNVGAMAFDTVDSDGTWHFSTPSGLGFSVGPDMVGGDPPGNFDPNGGVIVHGTDPDGMFVQVTDPANPNHWILIRQDGLVTYCQGGTFSSATMPDLTSRLWGGPGGPATPGTVTNPPELVGGSYDSVRIDSSHTTDLQSDATYLIDNLVITDGGKLQLAPDANNVTIYVTGNLTVEGENALLNQRLRAPDLKIYYLGDNPIHLSGGSRAYFTLMAPLSEIFLTGLSGVRTQFHGALLGRAVTVENATFHYDTATEGIGTGTLGTGVTYVHRHRI